MKKRIAISTENFMLWNGGIDFIKHIILALTSVAKSNNLEIFVFIKSDDSYKNYKGFNRIIKKINEKYLRNYIAYSRNSNFSEFNNCKFILYSPSNIEKILKKFSIDCFLPHFNPRYFELKILNLGYLYDCQHKYYPEFFSEADVKSRESFFPVMVNSNKKILVNSKSVKDDLIKFFNANPDNICTLPFTPKVKKEYLANNSKLIKKYNLPKKYFLISNQFWLHKDHPTAFKGFAKLVKEPQYQDIKLICTGLMEDSRRPQYIEELKQLVVDLNCKEKIICLGLIPKIEQIEIMKGSLAVVQTTLFEGGPGGGSVWDAISLGKPSIVSDISTNLEIENEPTVTFFKTKDADDLADKMEKAANNLTIKYLDSELLAKSEENIKKLGNELLNIIKKAAR